MATSNGELVHLKKADEISDIDELRQQLKSKDDVISSKDEVIAKLEKRVQLLENEVGVVWERLGRMGEEKREQEMRMVLAEEEAARSLTSMVAAQRKRQRGEKGGREREEQLRLQVAVQGEEVGHLKEQLGEEIAAHREDVTECERRWREKVERLTAQLQRARGLGMSASQPNIPSHYNTPPPSSPWSPQREHRPLQMTVSAGPPSYQQSTGQAPPSPRPHPQKAPAAFHTGVATFHGHLCYFSSFMSTQVHVYDTALGAWQLLPPTPVSNFGLQVVNQQVTTIGGRLVTKSSLCTTQLFSLSPPSPLSPSSRREREWAATLPSMRLARSQPATTGNSRLVIVAGGEVGDHKTFIADIEVLVLETGQWTQLGSSPLGNHSWLTAAICRDHLFLLEGCGGRERDSLHSLHMGALVETLQDTPTRQKKKAGLPWKQLRSAPVSNTTCVCAKGQLLAVGGIDGGGRTTDQIWSLGEGERWRVVGNLKSQRYRSLVAVTATGSLLVIGGLTKTRFTDHMEIFDAF